MKLSEISKAKEIINNRWDQIPHTPTGVLIVFNDDLWVTWKRMLPLLVGNRNAMNFMIKLINQLPKEELEEKRTKIDYGINDEIDAILADTNYPEETPIESDLIPTINEPEYNELGTEDLSSGEDIEARNRKIVRFKRRHGAEAAAEKFGLSTSRVFQIVRDYESGKRHSTAE